MTTHTQTVRVGGMDTGYTGTEIMKLGPFAVAALAEIDRLMLAGIRMDDVHFRMVLDEYETRRAKVLG